MIQKKRLYLEIKVTSKFVILINVKTKLIYFYNNYRLEIWPGYSTVIDEFENGLYLCCDITHRILRDENVLETMIE